MFRRNSSVLSLLLALVMAAEAIPAMAAASVSVLQPRVIKQPSKAPEKPVVRHLRLAALDFREVFTAPAHWDSRHWERAGLFAGLIATSAALDKPVRDWADRNHSPALDNVTRIAEPFGGVYAQDTIMAFLLGGVVTGNSNARETAFDSYLSTLIAAGVITPALKRVFGRSRPIANSGTFDFDAVDGGQSFPSGHATQAFTLATVIAAHYPRRWVQVTAYGLAGTVAFSRIYHDAHFTSDVVAGALIGIGVGRAVVRINDRERMSWTASPGVTPDGRKEILFNVRF